MTLDRGTTIELTNEAAAQLQALRAQDPDKRAYLRVYVAGRSCCSFEYGLAFEEKTRESDAVSEAGGLPIAIDPASPPSCAGAKVEWVNGPQGTGFLVRIPSLGGGCSCGS